MTGEAGFNTLPEGWEQERKRLMDRDPIGREAILNEALDKERAYQQQMQAQTGAIGGAMTPKSLDEPCRASLRERIEMDLGRARRESRKLERESRKLERLSELESLLDKNPEVARILDLIEDVRV